MIGSMVLLAGAGLLMVVNGDETAEEMEGREVHGGPELSTTAKDPEISRRAIGKEARMTSDKEAFWELVEPKPVTAAMGPLPGLGWVEPPRESDVEKIVAMAQLKFHFFDTRGLHSGVMLQHARPVVTREDAIARFVDSRLCNTPQASPVRAFELNEYYIFAPPTDDYWNNLEHYLRMLPSKNIPPVGFLSRGYAIRKSDGYVVAYSAVER